jgi:hypothetical protein
LRITTTPSVKRATTTRMHHSMTSIQRDFLISSGCKVVC